MFFTTTKATARVGEPSPKSIPEKLSRLFAAFKSNPTASSSSRSPPPIFHGSQNANSFGAGSFDSYYAPYDDFNSCTSQSRTTSATRIYRATPALRALLPKFNNYSAAGNPQIPLVISSCQVSPKRREDTVSSQNTAVVETCIKSIISPESSSPSKVGPGSGFCLSRREILQELAKNAVQQNMMSRWFPEKPITKRSRSKMTAVGRRAVLPNLEKFSTCKGLHGASHLGNGKQDNGLSYGKYRGARYSHPNFRPIFSVFQPRRRVALVSRASYSRSPTVLSTFTRPNKPNPHTFLPIRATTTIPSYKPQLVVRNGREEWSKIVDYTNQMSSRYPGYACNSQGHPVRCLDWI